MFVVVGLGVYDHPPARCFPRLEYVKFQRCFLSAVSPKAIPITINFMADSLVQARLAARRHSESTLNGSAGVPHYTNLWSKIHTEFDVEHLHYLHNAKTVKTMSVKRIP